MNRFTRTGRLEFRSCTPVRSRRRTRRTLFQFYVGLCGVVMFASVWVALWVMPVFDIQIASEKSPSAMARKAERMAFTVARGVESPHPGFAGATPH